MVLLAWYGWIAWLRAFSLERVVLYVSTAAVIALGAMSCLRLAMSLSFSLRTETSFWLGRTFCRDWHTENHRWVVKCGRIIDDNVQDRQLITPGLRCVLSNGWAGTRAVRDLWQTEDPENCLVAWLETWSMSSFSEDRVVVHRRRANSSRKRVVLAVPCLGGGLY